MKGPPPRQEETFPFIARVISQEAKRLSRSVHATEIAEAMLIDPDGLRLVRNAAKNSNGGWTDERHASNMVAFFSKRYTEKTNPYADEIDREGESGSYRYRPKQDARLSAAVLPGRNLSAMEWQIDPDYSAIEGNSRLVSHLTRERKPELREKKFNAERESGKPLQCETCGFESERAFPGLHKGIVILEIHHRQPLSHADGPRETRLKQLAILCPSCHRAIHRTHPMLSVTEFQKKVLKNSR